MRRFTAIVILAALFLSGCANGTRVLDGDAVVEHESHTTPLSDESFQQTIDSTPVVIVDFWAPWCGPCRQLGPTIEEVSMDYEGRALVAKLNVDEGKQTANALGVTGIPTLVFFKDGQEVGRLEGVASKRKITAILDPLIQ